MTNDYNHMTGPNCSVCPIYPLNLAIANTLSQMTAGVRQDTIAGAFVLVDNSVFRRQSRLAWQTLGRFRSAQSPSDLEAHRAW